MPLMEFAEDINGYGVKFDPETGKISYSIGGRIFKTLQAGVASSNDHVYRDFNFVTILILDGQRIVHTIELTGNLDNDYQAIMKAACEYAETL